MVVPLGKWRCVDLESWVSTKTLFPRGCGSSGSKANYFHENSQGQSQGFASLSRILITMFFCGLHIIQAVL